MSSENTIAFELISPEQTLVSRPVRMATLPGVAGEMGVGAGHASFLVALQSGVVKLYSDASTIPDQQITITGGFADITGERVVVLADAAQTA
ncbi:MAG: F0F1 ATP synthase subunit epsilon [Alphaproteobacteria bacterium]|nr:F0F1 ATP synthase subunit epsilon [Alphaproteobacteria bacterium]